MGQYPCPKCASSYTRVLWEGDCLVQKCICGMVRYLYQQTPEGLTVMRRVVISSRVRIPETGSKRHRCVVALVGEYPRPCNTIQVAELCKLQARETSAIMVMLMTTGVVDRVEYRKGLPGGSLWRLSVEAEGLLEIHRRDLGDGDYD